ncbi:WYL domain-containing protein [Streptomyces sp. NBC_01537]|uniref:helix-turn-helix transcriptional regulator n=1 Tax=Streptomyces sp. NBC_01537 TaxID=2903896 RepID=UPI0038654B6E
MHDASPTARALLALELVQNSPGITAARLADRLAVSERAVRRYVGILREAGIPIESVRGPYGGYRVGRGLRLPPLMFTNTEALGLVMAVLEGHHRAGDPADPVGSALGKIIRVLPGPVAEPADAVRNVPALPPDPDAARPRPSPETTALLVQACASSRRLRLGYRMGSGRDHVMEVDPWAVVVRHGLWYLLCWSHTRGARRVLRLDRVTATEVLPDTFTPPDGLDDPVLTLEQHLSEGWKYRVEVVIDAPAATVARCLPRSLGQLEATGPGHCRLTATTDEPDWYARQLMVIEAPFRIVGPPELREAARLLGQRLLRSST